MPTVWTPSPTIRPWSPRAFTLQAPLPPALTQLPALPGGLKALERNLLSLCLGPAQAQPKEAPTELLRNRVGSLPKCLWAPPSRTWSH